MKHTIVILDAYTLSSNDSDWEYLKEFGDLTIYERTDEDQVAQRIRNATIVLTNDVPISSQAIRGAKNLQYISVMSTGYDAVDIETAHDRGIIVTNVPAYSTYSVSQMTFALLLEICHHVGYHDREVHIGRWQKTKDFFFSDFPGIELHGKTMGIVGYGQIGSTVAQIAHAFGMKVLAYTRNSKIKVPLSHVNFLPFDDLCRMSDIISFHIPATEETNNLVDSRTLSLMKRGVILINTSRGAIFDDIAVVNALKSGHLKAIGIDVLRREPPTDNNPLLQAPNCIITPHIAWYTDEAIKKCLDINRSNIIAFLQNKIINSV
jgi:glycerate dehydrogenase